MGKPNFSDEFKRDAVAQIVERGYPVAEVSQRLGVSPHSLYAWKRQLANVVSGDANKDAEIRQLKRELARVAHSAAIIAAVLERYRSAGDVAVRALQGPAGRRGDVECKGRAAHPACSCRSEGHARIRSSGCGRGCLVQSNPPSSRIAASGAFYRALWVPGNRTAPTNDLVQ